MVRLEDLSKSFALPGGGRRIIADRIDAVFPKGVCTGLLGRNGAGKSTLLAMIAGRIRPASGRVITMGSVSWPIGLATAFHPEMSGEQNARITARLYGVDSDALVDFAAAFSGLGVQFRLPLRHSSPGMRARLALGIALGIRFDIYLVDELTGVGDGAFRARSLSCFQDRLRDAGAIFVSHSMGQIRDFCQAAAVLEGGRLQVFSDVEEAIHLHRRNLAR